jgi:SAM-dependent methyltransferase
MASDDNAAQVEFWNAVAGQKWVDHQSDLDMLLAGVSDMVLTASAAARGERVLDVGCGAGSLSFALAALVGHEGRVQGVDISVPLLQQAKAVSGGNVDFKLADAQDHAFGQGVFDLIASRFGVMFFADPLAAFRNFARALRPGGRIHFAAWSGPEVNPFFTIPMRVVVARLGPVDPVPPDAPGPMAFRDIPRVLGILRQAGFVKCEGRQVATALHHAGGSAAVTRLLMTIGPAGRVVAEKGGTVADLAAIEAALLAELQALDTPQGIAIPAGINMFSAVRA